MKAENYRDALALIAESDRRSSAAMIEHIAAAALLKLAPPDHGAVATLSISTADIESLYETHHFDTEYSADGTMTVLLTPLAPK